MALPLPFFPQTREPFGRLITVMLRLSPLDEFRLRSIRKDVYAPRVNTEFLPNLELVRKLGTSNIAFIRKTLSDIARAQSKFEIALSNPFLVDRSASFSLHLLAYAPALKIMRNRVRDNLKDIVVVHNPERPYHKDKAPYLHPYLSDVGTFPWSQDTKILLKADIPPEDRDAWLDHAKRQSSQRLNPVTAIGLTMVIYNYSHRVTRHDKVFTWVQVAVKHMRDSDIVCEDFPFEGEGIQAFDASKR
ncbi:uncharacterized protein EAF02_010802 [Botrytis sinoallii]|uniref:uncharacterized protein n=1 Tax=Botrytis sinoallii TaxID=1463999 RepID=UPI00190211A9|nr:uncharacterized protein EAF02_010802 [Botrytis sinoallii]KAF7860568.1 hypothetical protein EAF02_010802 [Botrytis sinoallii]